MKKFVFIILIGFGWNPAISQMNQSLPVDENGFITFSEVITVEGATVEVLFNNALGYMEYLVDNHKNLKKGPYANEDSTEVYIPLVFTVYKDFPVQSPDVLITYNLTDSVKEGRYRYVANNFVYHYLKRNRYVKFVEVKGKSKPLEDPVFSGNQKLWDKHKEQTAEKIASVTEMLQAEMMFVPKEPKEEIVKVVEVEDNW